MEYPAKLPVLSPQHGERIFKNKSVIKGSFLPEFTTAAAEMTASFKTFGIVYISRDLSKVICAVFLIYHTTDDPECLTRKAGQFKNI